METEEEPESEELVGDEDMRPPDHGLYCFLDRNRPCAPECAAYTNPPPARLLELSPQQQHCTLLVSANRLGRGASLVAQQGHEKLTHLRNSSADASRKGATHTVVPNVPHNPFSSGSKQ